MVVCSCIAAQDGALRKFLLNYAGASGSLMLKLLGISPRLFTFVTMTLNW
jgi:hypothetical protein